ncbi:MAG: hypothetical protein KKA19_06230, partial [Candidatus Margulisbacteria bacterium]|nr:hypothetical protein [Candidatus Margulisiibacteriota bacterium]
MYLKIISGLENLEIELKQLKDISLDDKGLGLQFGNNLEKDKILIIPEKKVIELESYNHHRFLEVYEQISLYLKEYLASRFVLNSILFYRRSIQGTLALDLNCCYLEKEKIFSRSIYGYIPQIQVLINNTFLGKSEYKAITFNNLDINNRISIKKVSKIDFMNI